MVKRVVNIHGEVTPICAYLTANRRHAVANPLYLPLRLTIRRISPIHVHEVVGGSNLPRDPAHELVPRSYVSTEYLYITSGTTV